MGRTGAFEAGTESLRMDLECTGRARSRAGAAARSKPPRGPMPRAGRRLKGMGGWVFPPGNSLHGGRLGKGGSRGENQGGGREARPVLTVPADLNHLPGGRGRAALKPRTSPRASGPVGGPRDAKLRGEARSGEARSSAGSSGRVQRSGRHSGARADGLPPAPASSPGASRRLVRSGCIDLQSLFFEHFLLQRFEQVISSHRGLSCSRAASQES